MSNTPVALSAAERRALISAAMKIVGSIKTPKKAAASARNGRLGGRPRVEGGPEDVSRQRRWQLRMRDQGRCQVCGARATSSRFCDSHADANNARQRARPRSGAEAIARWHLRNPRARKAHYILNRAVAAGRIKRLPCEQCGRRAYAHHHDYSKPLDVQWLCPRHHRALHLALDKASRRV